MLKDELTQAPELGLLECLEGPHEWGYRDCAEGTFVEDLTPFKAAERIRELEAQVRLLQRPHLEKLTYAVERAAEQFEFYCEQHLAKGTEESNKKAEVNRQLGEMCREALKEDGFISVISEEARAEPVCDYEPVIQQQPDKVCQNYNQANNLELANRIINLIAPHWNPVVRRAAADQVRYFLGAELTRFWVDIVSFHHKFHLNYDGAPRTLEGELREFRVVFMAEELEEYAGFPKKSLVNFVRQLLDKQKEDGYEGDSLERRERELDALVDLVYVALGTAYLHGFNFAEAWRRVQRANMAKVRAQRADQSKRGTAFDVVKPEGWTPPDHSDLVGVIKATEPAAEEATPVQHGLF